MNKLKGSEKLPKKSNKFYYNKTNTCDKCREKGKETKLVPGKALKEHDKNGNLTGKWLCKNCWYAINYKYRSDSTNNIIKSLANCRTGNQNPNSSQAKGDLFQELTCRWRSTVSTVPVEDLNKKLDNYNTPIDHSPDSELGIIQTKGCLYNPIYGWHQDFKHEHNQIAKGFKFDVLILYCVSEDGTLVERIYIIPWEEVIKGASIGIKNSSKYGWHKQYRIKDEEIIKKVNEIWKEIITERDN